MLNPNYVMREYDLALQSIRQTGFEIDGDRTGKGTICKFGINTEYDISKRVPILTLREVAFKSIIKEVLWYISGSHSINDLETAGAKIWTPWKNDAFTEKHGLPQGSGGYIYGFNLIHFGASIQDFEESKKLPLGVGDFPNAHGFNQLDYVIDTLRANPKSRQACFTFWRPDTNHMAILPACHAFYSFIVSPDENGELNTLNCHLFQRSADYPIGVGMGNLWTATLFVYMIAQQLGMKPGKLYHSGAHCHIYKNALEAVDTYLGRIDGDYIPNSPILTLHPAPSIYDYTPDHFEVSDYTPLEKIYHPIAV